MKAVYPPAQVAPYDSSSFGASPPVTRWTKLATRAVSGPAVTQPTKYFQALWHAHRARRRAFLSLTHVPYAFTSYASGPTDAI